MDTQLDHILDKIILVYLHGRNGFFTLQYMIHPLQTPTNIHNIFMQLHTQERHDGKHINSMSDSEIDKKMKLCFDIDIV